MGDWITIKQAARILECSKDNVLRRIKRGTLEATLDSDPKAGPCSGNMMYFIPRSAVEKIVSERKP